MDVQQQQCNHPSPFRSELDLQHQFYEGWTGHRSKDRIPIPPTKLRPIQPERSAAPHNVPQRAPSPHSVPPPPSSLPPELHLSRPNGFDDLLNPISGDKISVSGRQHDGEGTDSPWTAPMAAKSRLPTPSLPSTSMNKHSLGDTTLPSNAPALTNTYPYPPATIEVRQSAGSGPLLPSETATAWSTLPAAHTLSAPPPQPSSRLRQICRCRPNPSTYPGMQTPFDRLGNLAASANLASQHSSLTAHYRRNSPSSALPQATSTGEAQSSFSAPFTSSTMPQLEFVKETLDAPISGASGQSQSRMMIYKTEQGLIQVPVDVQAASKTAVEKRKRSATASHRFRQRRKENEKETSDIISKLIADVEYYQLERDFLQDMLQENRISIPPRVPSPRRRRHASLGGSQHHDTSAYAPGRWQSSHTSTIRAHTGATTNDTFPRAISS